MRAFSATGFAASDGDFKMRQRGNLAPPAAWRRWTPMLPLLCGIACGGASESRLSGSWKHTGTDLIIEMKLQGTTEDLRGVGVCIGACAHSSMIISGTDQRVRWTWLEGQASSTQMWDVVESGDLDRLGSGSIQLLPDHTADSQSYEFLRN